jgi:hypothetical protein
MRPTPIGPPPPPPGLLPPPEALPPGGIQTYKPGGEEGWQSSEVLMNAIGRQNEKEYLPQSKT